MQKKNKSILIICPYPIGEAPSQRFRFEQYFELLKDAGFLIKVAAFLSLSGWQVLYQRGNYTAKLIAILRGFCFRWLLLFRIPAYHWIFIHREATPLGPPVFEWIIARILRKKIIYDFDDAIWMADKDDESPLLTTLKWRQKVASICRWAYKVSCGNNFLCDYALQFNAQVFYNPTTIETNYHVPPPTNSSNITIGWTGSHSTLKYLKQIESAIINVQKKYPTVEFIVIADKEPNIQIPNLRFIVWQPETEIQDLQQINIGLMPLPNDKWAQGKCGFKALQYMALEIPAIVSPVGVNTTIIENKSNGFLANSLEEWEAYLNMLIENFQLRKEIGTAGRKKIEQHYSVASNTTNFLSLFE